MKHLLPIQFACAGCFLLAATPAQATLFYGQDIDKGPMDARPNSDAAHSAFLVAAGSIGSVGLEDFESQAISSGPNIDLGNGLHLAMSNVSTFQGIVDNPQDSILGYNTTSGGSKYMSMGATDDTMSSVSVFTFDTPVNSFGTYITAVGTAAGQVSVQWNDGVDHTFIMTGDTLGGCEYFGFTGIGPVTSIRIAVDANVDFADDNFGIDDIQYSRSTVPEPASFAVLGIGGIALLRRRKSRSSQ